MDIIKNVNPVQAYLKGMLWAAFGVRIFSNNVTEWQLDAVKESASKLKEVEIEHSPLIQEEKENQKRLWKQWIDESTKGFKEVLKASGRLN